jgi:MFS family permease
VFASAYWALLPLVARERLSGGAELYGLLVGSIGVGAVTGAIFLPRLRKQMGPGRLVVASTLATSLVLATYALATSPYLAAIASFVAGASWLAALSSFNISTQVSLPDWVRARGLAIFGTVFFGAMAGGSLLWGQLASVIGLAATLLVAAGGALACAWPATRFGLQSGGQSVNALDLTPSSHWPQPVDAVAAAADRGPVLVTVEYEIDPELSKEFLEAMADLGLARRRDGAYSWGVFQDVTSPSHYTECFFASSWLEHLRHHERVTEDDRQLQARIGELHKGPGAPRVRHSLAAGGRQ